MFKAAAEEQQFKADLNNHFTERFLKEQKAEVMSRQVEFDAREPMVELQRLSSRSTTGLTTFRPVLPRCKVRRDCIRHSETADLANMSWDDVSDFDKALKGEY